MSDDPSVGPWNQDSVDIDVLATKVGNGRVPKGKGQRTRRRLLDSAEVIFGTMDYHDASIVRIAEKAGVAQGTFYLYFSSKLQIFEEVVADLNHRVRRAMSEASRGATTRFEAERLGFAGFFKFTAAHPALYRVIRQAEFVAPDAMRHHYETVIGNYTPFLRQAMATGEIAPGDPTVLAWALTAVGEAIGMRWILWGDDHTMPPEVFDEMMNIVERMLGGPTEPSAATSTAPDQRSASSEDRT
jgi:AcrR family transcriptional regulator